MSITPLSRLVLLRESVREKKRRLLSRVKPYLTAVCRTLQNGDFPLPRRPAKHSSKRSKIKRSKFSRTYSTSTSSDSSSSGSESSSESASERSAKSPSRQNESAFEEPEVSLDESIVTFTAEAAFKGLSKSAGKSLLIDSRKGLLAKVSSDSLDIIEDPSLFCPGSTDLFGKNLRNRFSRSLNFPRSWIL